MEIDSLEMADQREYYTLDQLGEILKVSRVTLYRALRDGLLEGESVVNQWRIKPEAVDRFTKRCNERKLKRTKARTSRTDKKLR